MRTSDGHDIHEVAAARDDRVDAHAVIVREGLAIGVDRHQADHRGVERVDAQVRRDAGVGGVAGVADQFADEAVVRPREGELRAGAVLRAAVHHDRDVHIIELAEAHQLALAAEELQLPLLLEAGAVVDLDILLGGDGEEDQFAGEVVNRAALDDARRGGEHPGDLAVVAAAVRRAGLRVGVRVIEDDDAVQFAHDADRRAGPPAVEHRLDAGDAEIGAIGEAEAVEVGGDALGRVDFLEAEFGVRVDRVTDRVDGIAVRLDGGGDALFGRSSVVCFVPVVAASVSSWSLPYRHRSEVASCTGIHILA